MGLTSFGNAKKAKQVPSESSASSNTEESSAASTHNYSSAKATLSKAKKGLQKKNEAILAIYGDDNLLHGEPLLQKRVRTMKLPLSLEEK